MTPNNQFSKAQIDIFLNNGWIVYPNTHNIISVVKYPPQKPLNPTLIQFDYEANTLLVIVQDLVNYREPREPMYRAKLPEFIHDTITILKWSGVITENEFSSLNQTSL